MIEELKKVFGLKDLPQEHLQWILDHSEYHEFEDGAVVAKTGGEATYMWMIVEGKIDYYMDVNGTLVYYLSFENDATNGGITGVLPHSRMKVYGGSSFVVGMMRGFSMHKDHFPELEKLNPDLIQKMIGYMTERARTFATIQLQREKVSALGKLSAGIAHELNNPAAAINRIAAELKCRLDSNYELTAKLVSDAISPQQIADIRRLAEEKESSAQVPLTALQRMDREDEIADWFDSNDISEGRNIAETFSEFGFSTAELEIIRKDISSNALVDMLRWMENILISERLIKDLAEASSRISTLVGAIKSHVHMDRTNDAQPTNIHTDITNTLTLMGYKLRDKHITVTKKLEDTLPMVEAYVSELNQVWTNLIDNAIDALDHNGELTIETCSNSKDVTIRIIDNGGGIPKEIQSRIFDPFFTTKKVGQGTGIGLDLVKRIVDKHHGDIKVHSIPGRTEFRICLPLTQHLSV